MAGPGDGAAAQGRGRGDLRASHADREQVIGTLETAFVQGRLTEDELDARVGRVYASRTYAELAEVSADISAEGVCVIIAAASVLAAVLLWHPDNVLVFMAFLLAAAALIVAPVITVGLTVDVRHQKRSGGQGRLDGGARGLG